jgi:hypothetical protein
VFGERPVRRAIRELVPRDDYPCDYQQAVTNPSPRWMPAARRANRAPRNDSAIHGHPGDQSVDLTLLTCRSSSWTLRGVRHKIVQRLFRPSVQHILNNKCPSCPSNVFRMFQTSVVKNRGRTYAVRQSPRISRSLSSSA